MGLIDADELIKCIPPEEYNSRFAIMNAPTVELQKWIPCSERLPEETIKVLVQADDMYYNMNDDTGILIGWRNGNRWSTLTTRGWESIRYPIAWMPLPKPYKENK